MLGAGLPAVVIRPSHVYGPGGWYQHELIAQLRRPGRFAVIGSGENLWDVVHVDDVAAAFVLAVEAAAPGSLYHVADDEPITFYDFMALGAPRARARAAAAHAGAAREPRSGSQCGRRGCPIGALLEREDQARARLEPALLERASGRSRCDRAAHGCCLKARAHADRRRGA